MIITNKSYVQPHVKTSVFLASKPFLSILDHLLATFLPDLPVEKLINTGMQGTFTNISYEFLHTSIDEF